MSEVGGTPDLPWTRPEGPFIAMNGLWPIHNSNRNMAHRGAGGGSRPQHQKLTLMALNFDPFNHAGPLFRGEGLSTIIGLNPAS